MNIWLHIVVIAVSILIIVFGALTVVYCIEQKKLEKKEMQKRKKEREKNEKKESMETGNNSRDFDASIDIMHELAKRK